MNDLVRFCYTDLIKHACHLKLSLNSPAACIPGPFPYNIFLHDIRQSDCRYNIAKFYLTYGLFE